LLPQATNTDLNLSWVHSYVTGISDSIEEYDSYVKVENSLAGASIYGETQ